MVKTSSLFLGILIIVIPPFILYKLIHTESESVLVEKNQLGKEQDNSKLLNLLNLASSSEDFYSEWPRYSNFLNLKVKNEMNNNRNLIESICLKPMLEKGLKMSIETLESLIETWSFSQNKECLKFLDMFNLIYDVKFKQNNLLMPSNLTSKVKELLNDESLLETIYHQVINLINSLVLITYVNIFRKFNRNLFQFTINLQTKKMYSTH